MKVLRISDLLCKGGGWFPKCFPRILHGISNLQAFISTKAVLACECVGALPGCSLQQRQRGGLWEMNWVTFHSFGHSLLMWIICVTEGAFNSTFYNVIICSKKCVPTISALVSTFFIKVQCSDIWVECSEFVAVCFSIVICSLLIFFLSVVSW